SARRRAGGGEQQERVLLESPFLPLVLVRELKIHHFAAETRLFENLASRALGSSLARLGFAGHRVLSAAPVRRPFEQEHGGAGSPRTENPHHRLEPNAPRLYRQFWVRWASPAGRRHADAAARAGGTGSPPRP